jgi:hypothetical protein
MIFKKGHKKIPDRMRKLAHVPIQTWRGWHLNVLFREWFSALDGFKSLIGTVDLVLRARLILSCQASDIVLYQDHYRGHDERKTAAHIMML